MKALSQPDTSLMLKQLRVVYWEQYHEIPSMSELMRTNEELMKDLSEVDVEVVRDDLVKVLEDDDPSDL